MCGRRTRTSSWLKRREKLLMMMFILGVHVDVDVNTAKMVMEVATNFFMVDF